MLHTHRFRAMNCEMAVWLDSDAPAATAAVRSVETWMHTVEQALSRFRPDSDLSRLNAVAGQPHAAGDLLWQVTQAALAAAEATGGVFDPTIGQALQAAGYDRSFEILAAEPDRRRGAPASARPTAAAWQRIALNPRTRSITLPPGVSLDLGGIAKGWAADRALARLAPFGPALIDAGGDLAAGAPPPGETAWAVGIADPLAPDGDVALIGLANAGLATSGTDHRRWRLNGCQQHHLIDPARGLPAATDILNASVLAGSATDADVMALVLTVSGVTGVEAWLRRRPDLAVLLVLNDGRLYHTQGITPHVRAFFPTYEPA